MLAKHDYIMYGVESFLFSENTASFELIAESVSLAESNIATRMTESLVNTAIHQITRPHAGIVGMRTLV